VRDHNDARRVIAGSGDPCESVNARDAPTRPRNVMARKKEWMMGNTRYEDEDSGALFRVAEPKSPKHPTFTGVCTINSVKYRIAGWGHEIKMGERAGERYLKLKFTVADEQSQSTRPAQTDDDLRPVRRPRAWLPPRAVRRLCVRAPRPAVVQRPRGLRQLRRAAHGGVGGESRRAGHRALHARVRSDPRMYSGRPN